MTHKIDKIVADNLTKLIKKNQTNIFDLSFEIGVSHAMIWCYKTNKSRISSSRLWMIAEYFNVPIEYMFKEDVIK